MFLMNLVERGLHEDAASRGRLVIGEVFRLIGVEPEAGGDEHEDAGAEQEAALAFQARLAQQMLEGAVGHCTPFLTRSPPGPASCRSAPVPPAAARRAP